MFLSSKSEGPQKKKGVNLYRSTRPLAGRKRHLCHPLWALPPHMCGKPLSFACFTHKSSNTNPNPCPKLFRNPCSRATKDLVLVENLVGHTAIRRTCRKYKKECHRASVRPSHGPLASRFGQNRSHPAVRIVLFEPKKGIPDRLSS